MTENASKSNLLEMTEGVAGMYVGGAIVHFCGNQIGLVPRFTALPLVFESFLVGFVSVAVLGSVAVGFAVVTAKYICWRYSHADDMINGLQEVEYDDR